MYARRIPFRAILILSSSLQLAACTSPPRQSEREPAAARLTEVDKVLLTPLVEYGTGQRALFATQSKDERRFTVTECISPKGPPGQVTLESAECSQLVDKWIPLQEREFRARFGEAFENEIAARSTILGKRRAQMPFVGNLMLSVLSGFSVYGAAERYILEQLPTPFAGVRMLAKVIKITAAGTGVAMMLELENVNSSIRYFNLEEEIARKHWRLDQAQIPEAAAQVYAAWRASAIAALSATTVL